MLKKLSLTLAALCTLSAPAVADWTVDSAGPGGMVKIAKDSSDLLGIGCLSQGGGPQPTLMLHSDDKLLGFSSNNSKVGFLSITQPGGSSVKLFGYVIDGQSFIASDSKSTPEALRLLRRANKVELTFDGDNKVNLGSVDLSGSSKAIRATGC